MHTFSTSWPSQSTVGSSPISTQDRSGAFQRPKLHAPPSNGSCTRRAWPTRHKYYHWEPYERSHDGLILGQHQGNSPCFPDPFNCPAIDLPCTQSREEQRNRFYDGYKGRCRRWRTFRFTMFQCGARWRILRYPYKIYWHGYGRTNRATKTGLHEGWHL
jgi:hypothetical protein